MAQPLGAAPLTPGPCSTGYERQGEVLYSFKGKRDGDFPETTLVMDKAGNLYGTTSQGG